MKKLLSTLAVFGLLSLTPANAMTTSQFDFAGLADGTPAGGAEGDWNPILMGVNDSAEGGTDGDIYWTINNIDVLASAGGTGRSAYLDAGNAGLGVCSSTSCAGSPDDNVTNGEELDLNFFVDGLATDVTLSDLLFRRQNHDLLEGSVLINSIVATIELGKITGYAGSLYGDHFTFAHNGYDFYVSEVTAAVPIPAPLALFLTGLAGLGWIGRRKKKLAA